MEQIKFELCAKCEMFPGMNFRSPFSLTMTAAAASVAIIKEPKVKIQQTRPGQEHFCI
jgi:hypothetical protein